MRVVKNKLFFLILIILFIPSLSLSADQPNSTLQISPLKYEEKLNLGDVKEGTIDIANPTTHDEKIVIETASMKMNGISGELSFYKSDAQYNFEKFMTFTENEFTLSAGTGRKVKFRLGVPIGATTGGYFGGVFFRMVPESGSGAESKVSTSGRIGTLFLLNVGQGEVRQGELRKFKADNNPIADETTFEIEHANLAKYNADPRGTYLRPTGTVSIKNMFGKEIAMQKIENVYVLPETARIIKTSIKAPFLIGLYKADLNISNYPGDPVYTKSVRFIKISPLFILLVFVIAGFAFAGFSFFKKGLPKPIKEKLKVLKKQAKKIKK